MRRLTPFAIAAAAILVIVGARASSEHDNTVIFAINGLQKFSFYLQSYSIPGGQPFGGTITQVQGNNAELTVSAGRESSSQVADWFNQQVGQGQMFACDQGPSSSPNGLNFAVSGFMSIEANGQSISCFVVLAQGNKGTTNNWWVGASNLKNNVLTCYLAGTQTPVQAKITAQQGCINNFILNP